MPKLLTLTAVVSFALLSNPARAELLYLDFNGGGDNTGQYHGNLMFSGPGGFTVTFTDDLTDGVHGGKAGGAHITDLGFGNIKAGTGDTVLSTYNDYFDATHNWHSSGIVAYFNQGADFVSFDDTDDDGTVKALFAFNSLHQIIGQTSYDSMVPFSIDTTMTGGQKIHSVEFDTMGGGGGGSIDNTYFSLDNFRVRYLTEELNPIPESPVPEPATISLLALGAGLAGLAARRRMKKQAA